MVTCDILLHRKKLLHTQQTGEVSGAEQSSHFACSLLSWTRPSFPEGREPSTWAWGRAEALAWGLHTALSSSSVGRVMPRVSTPWATFLCPRMGGVRVVDIGPGMQDPSSVTQETSVGGRTTAETGPGFEVSEVLAQLLSLVPCPNPEGWSCFPTNKRLREVECIAQGHTASPGDPDPRFFP